MGNIMSQMRYSVSTVKNAVRQRLMARLHRVAYALEDYEDTLNRFGYGPLQTSMVKLGFDLGLFKKLSAAPQSLSSTQLAKQTGTDPVLMKRTMTYLAAIGAVKETGIDRFAPNSVTRNLAERATEAGISHCFATVGPIYQSLPSFLRRTEYRSPTDPIRTVFQDAWGLSADDGDGDGDGGDAKVTPFDWFASHPDELRYFNDYMALRRKGDRSWLAVYPVRQRLREQQQRRKRDAGSGTNGQKRKEDDVEEGDKTAVFVSIGGSIGHQCAEFKAAYPDIRGRVVLQDLPHTVEQALPTPGVENMAHDFFLPQPVKGARIYHARHVCHDWPDHKVVEILTQTKTSMAPDSILILDEMCLPSRGVNAYVASIDMTMMGAGASRERTRDDWRAVVEQAGLRLTGVWEYNPASYESVLEVRMP